jgi:hypothetical protein
MRPVYTHDLSSERAILPRRSSFFLGLTKEKGNGQEPLQRRRYLRRFFYCL